MVLPAKSAAGMSSGRGGGGQQQGPDEQVGAAGARRGRSRGQNAGVHQVLGPKVTLGGCLRPILQTEA